ncbi:MAG: GAF domain-containing protein [Bacteroidota bacterium]|nr:GAF domain-containing protein [Bacteroidota bacterium]
MKISIKSEFKSKFDKKHIIKVAISVVFLLILVGAAFSFYNSMIMRKALIVQAQSVKVLSETKRIYDNIQLMDNSIRRYALIRKEQFLFWPVESAITRADEAFGSIEKLFQEQGYQKSKNFNDAKAGMYIYIYDVYAKMIEQLKRNDQEGFLAILDNDPGVDFWNVYLPFENEVNGYENKLIENAKADYESAVQRNAWVQMLLLLIGLPTLAVLIITLNKDEKRRELLLLNLQENNQKYLFDSGDTKIKEEKEILDLSIENLQKASYFVNQISEGNYDVKWEKLTDEIVPLNQNNLAGRLIFMRDEMKKVKDEDLKRFWITDGLSKCSEIIRHNQQNLEELAYQSLLFLIKYLNSNQGSLYVLEDNENEEPYLRLASCYAFNRKKLITKRMEIGEGLLGQTYLEGETVFLKDLPNGYTTIKSGLGDSTPSCLVIVPLKYNEQIPAIIELASFEVFEPYQISFLERAGEFIASAIATAQNNGKTKTLLEQLQYQTEQLRSQEEEMRQNMEELEATQEEMRRKEISLQGQMGNEEPA